MSEESAGKRQHVYGPVPSRRLGSSLGVDLVQPKTCNFDCVYCQLGRTCSKVDRRAPYVPSGPVLEQVQEALQGKAKPDFVTVAGTGEPTLNSNLEEILRGIKALTEVPVAVLTNGSLLWDDDVARACRWADLVLPSLDAGDQVTFERVNRPAGGLQLRDIVDGIRAFRQSFDGAVWLEVMLVDGFNTERDELEKIAAEVKVIEPDMLQINTVTRPPAQSGIEAASPKTLEELKSLVGPRAQTLDQARPDKKGLGLLASRVRVVALLERRPCTLEDVSSSMGISPVEASKILSILVEEGTVLVEHMGETRFYRSAL